MNSVLKNTQRRLLTLGSWVADGVRLGAFRHETQRRASAEASVMAIAAAAHKQRR